MIAVGHNINTNDTLQSTLGVKVQAVIDYSFIIYA